jgi:hypothetical protein
LPIHEERIAIDGSTLAWTNQPDPTKSVSKSGLIAYFLLADVHLSLALLAGESDSIRSFSKQ